MPKEIIYLKRYEDIKHFLKDLGIKSLSWKLKKFEIYFLL